MIVKILVGLAIFWSVMQVLDSRRHNLPMVLALSAIAIALLSP